jgi:cellulose synthase/poly-beta-1,6-N-acetylglucosamine synthase-like glycosyltransferase
MVILPRWQRGGRVSSINTALFKARGDVFLVLDGDTTFDNDMVWHITRHFEDPNVPAVSGNLRPANVSVNLTTRIQGIEYLLSILGARTGLGFFNMVNNVSGAFGAFRTATVRLLGGWDTHTAEDLDMTLRLKSYFGHYRNMRIPFEPRAIGHTCVPESFGEFLEQRKRWDGDLPFIYLRKHWRAFSPTLTGWSNFLLNVFYGLSIQLLLPLLLVVYLLYLLVALPWLLVLGIMLLVYVIYLSISLFMFLVVWGLMSERPRQDAALIPYLLIFPFYMFCMRWWSAAAILHEMFNRGHLDSSMAPYWVLKRGRKF